MRDFKEGEENEPLNPVVPVGKKWAYRVTVDGLLGDLLMYLGKPGAYTLDRSFRCPTFIRVAGELLSVIRVDLIDDSGKGSLVVRPCAPKEREFGAFQIDRLDPAVLFEDGSELVSKDLAEDEMVNHWSVLGDGPASVKNCLGSNVVLFQMGAAAVYAILRKHAQPVLIDSVLCFAQKQWIARKLEGQTPLTDGVYQQHVMLPGERQERLLWSMRSR